VKTAFALIAVAALLALSAPPWPDDWDGIGFVASIARFDLDRFSPHPPGYPVYVVLLRIAALALRGSTAANAVAIVSGIAAIALLGDAAERAGIAGRRWAIAVIGAPLVWRASSAVGSEAPALAFAALAAWGIARRDRIGSIVVGVAVGLGLGVRLSWAPFYLPMLLFASQRARAAFAASVATAAWAAPFVAIVGPSHLAALLRVHFAGHAERWGGTAITEPGFGRVTLLLRDVFVDGIGVDRDPLGIVIAFALFATIAAALAAWRESKWQNARIALAIVPYALWIAVGQNLRQQPRHVLPLVAALAAALAFAAARSERVRTIAAVLALLVVTRTAFDAYARRTTPPPGEQLAEWLRDRPDAIVFGGASARFLEYAGLGSSSGGASTLGDVTLAVARRSPRPAHVYATTEISGADSGTLAAELCRPPRIDRRAPCLRIYDVTAVAR
jgi:hypothetical protein